VKAPLIVEGGITKWTLARNPVDPHKIPGWGIARNREVLEEKGSLIRPKNRNWEQQGDQSWESSYKGERSRGGGGAIGKTNKHSFSFDIASVGGVKVKNLEQI